MIISALTVIQSHLSDSLIELSTNKEQVAHRIGFIGFLLKRLNGDLTCRIDPDEMYEEYLKNK